jgi:hypothetical protein
MSSTTMFVEKETVESGFLRAITKLETNIERVEMAINHNRTYLQKNSYQLLVNLMNPENEWERILFSELMTMCFQLELRCHGSSIYFLRSFTSFAREYVKGERETFTSLVEHNQEEKKKYLDLLLSTCTPATQQDIDGIIDTIAEDSISATITKEAVALAGIEGNIVVDDGEVPNSLVELQFGYNFPVDSFKGFLPHMGTWSCSDIKVLLIDGMIEQVSELDKVLSKCWETQTPLLLVAQGFSEEVIATIYTNTSRGNFNVMPLRLQQSLEALNMLNDIAVVSGGDVVSTLKGEMLSFVDFNILPMIQKATVTGKVLTIHNNSTRPQVVAHLNYLSERRKEQQLNTSITDLSDLTTKRIGNLLAHLVKITLPKNESEKRKGRIDNAIRAFRSSFTYGFCNPATTDITKLSKRWQKSHIAMMGALKENRVVSVAFYFAAGYAADLAAGYFTSAGAVVVSPQ